MRDDTSPSRRGFDVAALRTGEGLVKDRAELGAKVTGTVACEWIGRRLTARPAGDVSGAQRAVTAMSSSQDWAILEELESQGGWSPVVWELADSMPTHGLNSTAIAAARRRRRGASGAL